jgi:hypothetical protein
MERMPQITLPELGGKPAREGILPVIKLTIGIWIVLLAGNILAGNWIRNADDADFGVESTRTAAAILHDGRFSDPFEVMATGPSSHVAPAYPVLYAGVIAAFGAGKTAWWAIRAITLGAYALQLALLPGLVAELGMARQIGVLAAVIGCLVPIPGSCYKWEAIFSGLMLVILAYLTVRLRRAQNVMRIGTSLGIGWGVGFLFSPAMLAVFLAWLALMWLWTRRKLRPRLAALVICLAGLMVLPWMIRDYKVFHAVIFIRDNFGTELAVSNNDCAAPSLRENLDCTLLTHPNHNAGLALRILEVGEYQFNREQSRKAQTWMREHPERFLSLTARHFLLFWFPAFAPAESAIVLLTMLEISLITALTIPGLVWLSRNNRFAAYLLASGAGAYSVAYYLVQMDYRYRYPILWISYIAAAFLLKACWDRFRNPNTAVLP